MTAYGQNFETAAAAEPYWGLFCGKNLRYTRSKIKRHKAGNAGILPVFLGKNPPDYADLYAKYGQPPYWDLSIAFAVRV